MSFFSRFFQSQPDAAATLGSQLDKLADEYVSRDFGTQTIWEPYRGLPCDPRPDDATIAATVEHYWVAFARFRPFYERNMARNPNEDDHPPSGFPCGALGFQVFDPNAPLLHFSEIPRFLGLGSEEIQVQFPPVKIAFIEPRPNALQSKEPEYAQPCDEPNIASVMANASNYWLPFLGKLSILGTNCTIFELRNRTFLIKEEYAPYTGQFVHDQYGSNILWLPSEASNLLRRLFYGCIAKSRARASWPVAQVYGLVRECTFAIFYERLRKWDAMEWPRRFT